jgi:predicted GTPase
MPITGVVVFTQAAEQNIGTAGKLTGTYPPELSGEPYLNGIPILPEKNLERIIKEKRVNQVILAYSDLSFQYVMEKASEVPAWGADFRLTGIASTMLKSEKPVISICAVGTGCGKSQTTRRVCEILKKKSRKIAVIRHHMPYGDLRKQILRRYEKYEDMQRYECTIEEMEEYEPHIERGNILYAGVDYGEILRRAEKEADMIVWDGGNNDLPFYKPDLHIALVDPHRPGHELGWYPGMSNLLLADVALINKVDTAEPQNVELVKRNSGILPALKGPGLPSH